MWRCGAFAILLAAGLAACTQYEVNAVYEPPILLVEDGQLREFHVTSASSWVINDGEGFLVTSRTFMFDERPPRDGWALRKAIHRIPRSRSLADNLRHLSLVTVTGEIMSAEERHNEVGDDHLWFLVANSPVTLARRLSLGKPRLTYPEVLWDCAFVTHGDLHVEIAETVQLPWHWSRIRTTWEYNHWSERPDVFQQAVVRTTFDPPRTLGDVIQDLTSAN